MNAHPSEKAPSEKAPSEKTLPALTLYPGFKLVQVSWQEAGSATCKPDVAPKQAIEQRCLVAFTEAYLHEVLTVLRRGYRDRGYAYRNVSATECQMWKAIERSRDEYSFIRLRIVYEPSEEETKR